MKEKVSVRTDKAPTPAGPYSQGIVYGDLIFVAGQGPVNPATGKIGETIEEQTRQVLENIRAILEAAGAGLDDVLKCTVHLADMRDFARFNQVYKEYFNEPYPVRTTVGSSLNGILVEIDVIARLPK